jgi:hypothetical protein
MQKLLSLACVAAVLLLAGLQAGHAQATRTWVSGVGDDANPCSRTAPCKTFAGAISKTAPRGEISVLDPGGYGALTITKSLSIVADGNEGSVLVSGVNGIVINAAATDDVSLRGVLLEGIGTGLVGVKILSARSVSISKCLIRNFRGGGGAAVAVMPSAGAVDVYVSDCELSSNLGGVAALPTGTGKVNVTLNNVAIVNNTGTARQPGQHILEQYSRERKPCWIKLGQ